MNDGIFAVGDLVSYYNKLDKAMGHAANFARLFMIPNMAHCGGPDTTDFSANMLSAITGWVEHGVAPDEIVAANPNKSSPFPDSSPFDPRVA